MEKYPSVDFQKLHDLKKPESLFDEESKNVKKKYSLTVQQILGMILGFVHYTAAGILSGYASVVITQLKDTQEFAVTKNDASWIASIVVIPTAPSSLLSGFLLTKMSKKSLLIIITLVELSSWIVIYNSTSVTGILIGRVLTGMPSAMGSPIIPPYLGEISHPGVRGLGLSLIFLGMAIGMIIIHTLGAFFTWRMCALITACILGVYFILVLYLKETYVWYLKNNNLDEARNAFHWYRGHDISATSELSKLIQRQNENTTTDYSLRDMMKICFSKLLLMPLLITVVGMVTMHLSGNKIIMFYSISIVSSVVPSLDQYASTIIVDAIRIAITLIACGLINKFPIRILFIVSGVGSALSHFCFAGFNYYAETVEEKQVFSILALVSLLAYIVCSSIGLAPLTWVIAGEIFPMIVKNIGSGLCCFAYFSTFFVVVKLSPDLFDLLGTSGSFLFFGICTSIGTLIMYFILPETRKKTLKEIEDLFRG